MEALAAAVKAGSRRALSKALTLTESTLPEHQAQASELLQRLLPEREAISGIYKQAAVQSAATEASTALPVREPLAAQHQAFSIGISGAPGAGKSSLIDALGCQMLDLGQRVAVLAVDPSSEASGGAILGDKTRMSRHVTSCLSRNCSLPYPIRLIRLLADRLTYLSCRLSSHLEAYVRPSPSRGTLGGVARSTSEALLLCTAAGYTRIMVETVGVGQSEIAVADLVDCMVLVLPPVGGDELQSIKRGITEVADVVVVNKADGPTRLAAARAAASFRATLHLHRPLKRSWAPKVLAVSAHSGAGLDELAEVLEAYWAAMRASGELEEVRQCVAAGNAILMTYCHLC